MRLPRRWMAALLGFSALVTTGVALTIDAPDSPPSETQVQRALRSLSARRGLQLHSARCVRDEVLQRTFVCLVQGRDDLHLAWRVRWLPGGRLDVRRPDGSPMSFDQL